MATIQNNIEGIKTEVVSGVKNFGNQLQDTFNGIVGNVTTGVSGIYGGDVVGLNVDQIPAMQNAIRNYISTIDNHLKEVNASAETANAYKGEFAPAIRTYVEAVCNACGALTSQLLKFIQTLEEVKIKYMAHDEDLKSQLGNQSAEMNSAFTRYTE